MNNLDKWVSVHGTGTYTADQTVIPPPDLQILPIFGMQQNRNEIKKLVEIIAEQLWYNENATALEIGLGHFGSSHFLWRQMFKKTTTIEINHDRVNRFSENIFKFYNQFVLDDGKSSFVIGSSQHPSSVKKVYDSVGMIDFLFIDGDHSYSAVLSDWLLYSPLVRPGGMVVFDDSAWQADVKGVPTLLEQLKNQRFKKAYDVKNIVFSKNVGISYYIV
jgi:predicted O-methyltransferase YrrM